MIFREENDGKYVQGVLFEEAGRLYEAKLDEECFDLLKKATAIIDDLEHMPRIEQDSLRLITLDRISGAIFTIGAAADTLPRRARTPNLHNIVDCSILSKYGNSILSRRHRIRPESGGVTEYCLEFHSVCPRFYGVHLTL